MKTEKMSKKYKDILNNNYHKIIKDQIFPYMSFNVDNFIAAPNESLLIDSKVDENGNFQKLFSVKNIFDKIFPLYWANS